MKLLPNFNSETVRLIVKTDFPDLEIQEIKLIENGWDNVAAEINGEYIFRFPKNDRVNIELEIKVLDSLKGKITLAIPKVKFRGKDYDYYGYQKVQGVSVTNAIYDSRSAEEKIKLAFDLANFLQEIHNSMTVIEARKIGVSDRIPRRYFSNVKDNYGKLLLNSSELTFIKNLCDDFEKILSDDSDLVLLHNDLHEENIALDPEKKVLNGVFDFGDISIGKRELDFGAMGRFYGIDLTERMIDQYEKITGRKLDRKIVYMYAKIWEISDVIEDMDNPDSSMIHQSGIERIKKWAKKIID